MPRVLTACASMSGRVWVGNSRIEIKMSFNIQTGDLVAGYKIIAPETERSGWRGWTGTWSWTWGLGDVIVLLEGLPPVRVRNGWLRMATTLISQRQLADGELADGDDEDWLFVVDVDDDDATHVYRVPQILIH